jgi:uncharacterized glyoxalase superfamily protein PhnB
VPHSATCASHYTDGAKVAKSSMLSVALGYRDVAAASDWLCTAFGFQRHFVAASETGVVHFAQLTFGNAMLTLVSVHDTSLNKYMKQPDEIGGAETQSCYLLVIDADAHCARARSSGAEIILDIQDDDFGGRGYACRDLEGHIWNFGTYDPWQGKHPGNPPAQSALPNRRGVWRWTVAFGVLATIVASLVVARNTDITFGPRQRLLETVAKEAEERAAQAAQERLNTESNARENAEHAKRVALEQLGREHMARETAERAAEQAGKRMEEERRARNAAENFVREVRQELDRMRSTKEHDQRENEPLDRVRQAKEISERNAERARQQVTEEQNAKEAAERTAQEMREQLDHVREAKELAERNAEQARQRASEQYSAKEAAERAAQELREQLSRERSAKNAAVKTAAQLRRQLSQVQNAKQP